ncbi:MAG: efflux RND transporter periplasmic adaptor subunit [Gemmataceae bacterium]|nr:efflux RND transporter periplasmic adaptor subunit [Gemmataceae bacterium]
MSDRRCRPAGLAVALGCAAALAGCGKPPEGLPPPEPPTVTARHPAMTPYNPVKDFTGRLQTKDPVKAVPRVSGMVARRAFKDGDAVEKDKTVLFEIDKALFEADLRKAKADVQKAEADEKNWVAQIKLAQAELDRSDQAYKKGAAGKTDFDKAVATLEVDKAQFDVAKATREAAAAAEARAAENLKYCTVYAPATGTARRALVAENGIVEAYKTELVEVAPVDTLYAVWEVDELTSLWYRDRINQGQIDNPKDRQTPLQCWITRKDGSTFPPLDKPGQAIDYYDPEIVRGTGTRMIRAEFPNPEVKRPGKDGKESALRLLSSGDSVRVRVTAGRPEQVLTVPETAVFPQGQRRYVYVVAPGEGGDKADLREVQPGATFDGKVAVKSGLTTADRVVVDNLLRVRPGAAVKVKQ